MSATGRTLTHKGETLTVREWAERRGCDPRVIYGRLTSGWPVERAINAPVRRHWRTLRKRFETKAARTGSDPGTDRVMSTPHLS